MRSPGEDSVSRVRLTLWLDHPQSWPETLAMARWAEAAGVDALRVDDGDGIDLWALLPALAAALPRVALEAVIDPARGRHPAVVAKWAATVDRLSVGRLVLGWQVPLDRTETAHLLEMVDVVRLLFDGPRATYDGQWFQLHDAPLEPKPTRRPMPVLFYGGPARVAAGHAEVWSVEVTADAESELADACLAVGRDRSAVALSLRGTPDTPPGPGADGWVVRASDLAGPDLATMQEQLAATVALAASFPPK